MMATIATLFYHPMQIRSDLLLWLVVPLCLTVSIVYKTIRTQNLRRLPLEVAWLCLTIFGGLVILAGVLWIIQLPGLWS